MAALQQTLDHWPLRVGHQALRLEAPAACMMIAAAGLPRADAGQTGLRDGARQTDRQGVLVGRSELHLARRFFRKCGDQEVVVAEIRCLDHPRASVIARDQAESVLCPLQGAFEDGIRARSSSQRPARPYTDAHRRHPGHHDGRAAGARTTRPQAAVVVCPGAGRRVCDVLCRGGGMTAAVGGIGTVESPAGFDRRVVVVTGAASGIGKSCAELLARRGARVVVADRNADEASRVAAAIGGSVCHVDISDAQAIEAAAVRIEADIGPVEMLVANAGVIQTRPLPPEELTLQEWDRIFAIDLRGTYQCCVSFGTRMAKRGSGSIVNIASVAGMRSTPLHAYGAAKAAVLQMTANLAVEWGRSGVRVNSVSPGYVLTPAIADAIARRLRDPAVLNEMSALGRMVQPEQIAAAVAFLLSHEASAITGINLPVDNGWLATGSWQTYGGAPPPR
ncbi:MAG: SDR family oxidoreductase [Pseudomonadota bacterium]